MTVLSTADRSRLKALIAAGMRGSPSSGAGRAFLDALVAAQTTLSPVDRTLVEALITAQAPSWDMLRGDDERFAALLPDYDTEADMLYIRVEPAKPGINKPAGHDAWLRYAPETNEVLGAHVEGWERFFLPLHPEFKEGWEQVVKPHLADERQASAEEIARFNLALMHRILDWLRESELTDKKQTKARA